MGAWLKASRLRLNATKTQVMWLGSQQMLDRLDIDEMPVLSSTIPVQTVQTVQTKMDSEMYDDLSHFIVQSNDS